MGEQDADEPSPDKACQRPTGSTHEHPPERRRNEESNEYPQGKEGARLAEGVTLADVFDVPLQVGGIRLKHPPHVGMPQPSHHPPDAGSLVMGGVRVLGVIAVLVM